MRASGLVVVFMLVAPAVVGVVAGTASGRFPLAGGTSSSALEVRGEGEPLSGTSLGSVGVAWPSARQGQVMALDAQSGRLVVFGGATMAGWTNDTWVFDPATTEWTEAATTRAPPPQMGSSAAFDSASDRVLLVGGPGETQTWSYDVEQNEWVDLAPPSLPPIPGTIVYDSKADKTLFYGYGQTWAYDYPSNSWSNRTSASVPSASDHLAMAYDSGIDRTILFGGGLSGPPWVSNETWEYDYANNTWTNRTTSGGPPALLDTAMVYDSSTSRIVLYGGQTRNLYSQNNRTWTFDVLAGSWVEQGSSKVPGIRQGHSMAFDSTSEASWLFGGGAQTGHLVPLDDLWTYTSGNDTWNQVLPRDVSPPLSPGPDVTPWLWYILPAGVAVLVVAAWLIHRRGTRPPPPRIL